MAKFRFIKSVRVSGWLNDTYEIEADTYEEAEQVIREASHIEDVAEFVKRDTDALLDTLSEIGKCDIYNEEGEEIY